ncbi:coiled-coil-helix-coiled-coil-helix domain-containing protein 10, mitochondrial-like [Battus philenor]|uniref:coiled-coil-helix-coiled-coil-helix domain-containing protein 10, mitochondrial-like n=1 Tax=Battus philenor TaxID=42288 RepID=UPI0035D083A5
MSSKKGKSSRRNSRTQQHAPAHPPAIIITPAPKRRSLFGEAASIAGGVTVGTAMGHVAGEAITSLFSGPRRQEVVSALPHDYQPGTESTGPCAYEISQFLQCAATREDLQECAGFNEALRECKKRNRLP